MEQRLLLLSVTVTGGADMIVTIMKTLGYSATHDCYHHEDVGVQCHNDTGML